MKAFTRLFRPSLVAENGDAIPFIWVATTMTARISAATPGG